MVGSISCDDRNTMQYVVEGFDLECSNCRGSIGVEVIEGACERDGRERARL